MRRDETCSTPACRGPLLPRGYLRLLAAPLLLAAAFVPDARADSTLQSAAAGSGPISASAHLDFRITVLPSFGLAIKPGGGVRVQGNSGALTLQRDHSEAWDGRAPNTSSQVRPRHQVIDTAVPTPTLAGTDRITIASP